MDGSKSEVSGAEHLSVQDNGETKSDFDKSQTSAIIGGFEADLDDLPPGYFKSRFFLGTFMAIGLGLWAGVGAFGYAAPILAMINEDVGPDPRYTWIALVYNASLAVCIAPLGRISDIFGRRYWFIGCGALSVLGCIVCATAKSIPILIGGNVFLGIGSASQLSFHYVLGEIVPIKYRYMASAVVYAFCLPGSGVAPIIAYGFIQNSPSVGWRGIYWLLLAVNALALACWVFFYFPPTFDKKHRHDANASKGYWVKNFDYIGTFLFAAGIVLFLMGLSWGGSVYPWVSAPTLSAIVIGFVLLIIFALWEVYAPLKEPLIPIHLFKNPEWVVAVLLMSLGASIYYGFAIVWPAQCAVLYNTGDLIYLGAISSIIGLAVIGGQVVGGSLANRIGHARYQVMAVFTIAAAFLGSAAVSQPDNFNTALALVIIGVFFTGWNETICIANSTICVRDQKEIGIAGGIAGSIRSAICGIVVAVYTTVLTNRLTQTVSGEVPPALVDAGLPASSVADFITALSAGATAALAAIPGITDKIIAVGVAAYQQANADAYRTVYLTTLAFSGVAICLTWWAPDTDKYMTSHVAATLHREEVSDEEKVVTRAA